MEIHSVRPIKKCTSFSSSKTWCRISRKLIRIWRWWWLLAALLIKLVIKVWISLLSKNQSIYNQFIQISYKLSKKIKFIVHLFNCKIKRLNIHNLQKYKMLKILRNKSSYWTSRHWLMKISWKLCITKKEKTLHQQMNFKYFNRKWKSKWTNWDLEMQTVSSWLWTEMQS